ncbi:GlxA family transcriptional regulator [Coraliomargarita algicola]|uniref:GlxA family transcriptional regulator n=1 Tax=Coraliomargarita algicola TaxID=3092156 RepID=A0ABZ0RL43_9BACT|nr:GlxA family transcriptional regulator [Coraliomargarita sp. J2-16]WPJ95813.1 GlxA family transcriptional regulator [Coraliomargarita sp. J2-16]
MPIKVRFFIFPGIQMLDLAGPLAAFEIAQRHHGACSYELETVSLMGGPILCSNGLQLDSQRLSNDYCDSLIVIGSDEMASVCECTRTLDALRYAAERTNRIVSVCTGAFLLASTGLLSGVKVTTHWRFAELFRQQYPEVQLEPDRIFLKDGNVWSSAGITSGIDLALALIEEDFGESVARSVAQDLVVYLRRPGGQSQYSELLQVQARSERMSLVLSYARAHLGEDLSVDVLAEVACLSPRQFARVFREETGQTPAKAVELLRVRDAQVRIEAHTSQSLEEIALKTGFLDMERMRRSFLRLLGRPPQTVRREAKERMRRSR